MSVTRRLFVRTSLGGIALGALALSVAASGASAQQARAPNGPIEIVVGSSAGSSPDVLMRRMAQLLNESKIVENPLAVVNRVGGSWAVATKYIIDRPGNENVVLCQTDGLFATPILQGSDLYYDKITPLGIFVQNQLTVVVQPNHKAATLKDLLAMAKAAPKQLKFAGSSPGLVDEQTVGLLEKASGADFTFIPHSGGGAAMQTFLGGNTDGIILPIDEALPQIKGGKAKMLALLSDKRHMTPEMKDIPTAREQGIDVIWGQHFGLLGTGGLDPAVQKWWEEKLTALVKHPTWQKAIDDNQQGNEFIAGSALPNYMATRHQTLLNLLRELGAAKI